MYKMKLQKNCILFSLLLLLLVSGLIHATLLPAQTVQPLTNLHAVSSVSAPSLLDSFDVQWQRVDRTEAASGFTEVQRLFETMSRNGKSDGFRLMIFCLFSLLFYGFQFHADWSVLGFHGKRHVHHDFYIIEYIQALDGLKGYSCSLS